MVEAEIDGTTPVVSAATRAALEAANGGNELPKATTERPLALVGMPYHGIGSSKQLFSQPVLLPL